MSRKMRNILVLLLVSGSLLVSRCAFANEICGDLENSFGPWDYRKANPKDLRLVERFHFSSDTENLIRGTSSVHPGGDLDYLLRVFPNHHRGLRAMSQLALRTKTDKPLDSRYTMECWFDRAQRMAPDDWAVYLIAGIHLLTKGNVKLAIEKLNAAERLNPNEMNIEYNLGLAYIQTGDLDSAVLHAKKAYALGHPLPGLRNKLKSAGRSLDSKGLDSKGERQDGAPQS